MQKKRNVVIEKRAVSNGDIGCDSIFSATSYSASLFISLFLILQLFHSDHPTTKDSFFGGDSTGAEEKVADL